MPSIDRNAKMFETTLASWFAWVVRTRRRALKLTASELSRRTAELGCPITRGAIAKIESDVRSGKIDVAEVLVLAAALDIPPVLMLFPHLSTNGYEQVLPGVTVRPEDAVRWMAGRISLPQEVRSDDSLEGPPHPPNDGVNLIAAVSLREQLLVTRTSLVDHLYKVREDAAEAKTAQRMLEKNNEQLEAIQKQIRDAHEALWGMRPDPDEPEAESDDVSEEPEDESDG